MDTADSSVKQNVLCFQGDITLSRVAVHL